MPVRASIIFLARLTEKPTAMKKHSNGEPRTTQMHARWPPRRVI
jgi:hypothetical protein